MEDYQAIVPTSRVKRPFRSMSNPVQLVVTSTICFDGLTQTSDSEQTKQIIVSREIWHNIPTVNPCLLYTSIWNFNDVGIPKFKVF